MAEATQHIFQVLTKRPERMATVVHEIQAEPLQNVWLSTSRSHMSEVWRSPRSWGYWTRVKLQILERYLAAFAKASKSSSERVYLDAFAGEGFGVDRLTGEEVPGSGRIDLGDLEPAGGYRYEKPSSPNEFL